MISALQGQLPKDVPLPTSDTPAIRHQGEVTIADVGVGGGAISLTAPSSDPRWGEGSTESYESDAVSLNLGNLMFDDIDFLALPSGTKASYQTCSSATAYGDGFQVDPDMMEGDNICLRTSDGRYASVV
jgi:hypothetical protein